MKTNYVIGELRWKVSVEGGKYEASSENRECAGTLRLTFPLEIAIVRVSPVISIPVRVLLSHCH
jgi:hypothetical protein